MALRLVSDAPARSGGLRLVEDVAPVGRLTAKASGGAGFKDKKAEAIWGGSFDEWKKRKEAADAEQARMVAESEAGNVGSRRAQDFQRKVAALNAEGDLTGDYSADSLRPGRALESGMEQGREQIGAGLQLAGETPLALADFFGRIRPKGETEQDRANPLTEAGKDIRSAAIARQQELAPLMIDRPDSLLSLQGAKYIAQSTLQSAPVTGAGLAAAVVNPAAGLSLMGAGAGSAKFADARAEDKNFWLAAEAGAAAAAAEVVPEMLPLGFLSGRLMKHLPGSAMKRMAANPAGRGALLALSEGASEGVTELANIAYEIGREGKSYTDDQIEKRLIDATAVGTVMGGGMSAVAELSGQNQRAYDASGIARLELENSLRDAIKPARATTARILGPAATPEAAAGAQMADDAFKAAGVGTVAAADLAEQDALERDLDAATRDQLGSEAEIDRLLTGGINAQAQAGSPGTVLDGQDAGRTGAAIPGISGSLPAGVRASYPGDQAESGAAVGFVGDGSLGSRNAPAPQQFTELANGTIFVPGDPVQLRQRAADAGFDVRGLAETRNGVPGVRFGTGARDQVIGLFGGSDPAGAAEQSRPSAPPEAAAVIAPPALDAKRTYGDTVFDERAHDLLDFIALNGGLDRTALESEGIDPANWNSRAAKGKNDRFFGKPLFRKTGGMSLETLREKARDAGFRTDKDVLDLIGDSLGGRKTFTPAGSEYQTALADVARQESDTQARQQRVNALPPSVPETDADAYIASRETEFDAPADRDGTDIADIESTLASVADTSPEQRASVVSLGSDYTRRLLELKKLRGSWGLNPDQQEEYTNLLEQDRETGKVGGRPIPGVGNKTAYVDALMQGNLMPVQVFLDADNFKALNDKFGHDVGDDAIRLIADVVRAEFGDGNVFHRGGDEFLTQGMTQEEVDAKMARVQDYLARVKMELPLSDGRTATLTGVGVSYGTGANEKAADDSLKQDKQRRKDAGLRFDRREGDDAGRVGPQPVGAGAETSGTDSRDSSRAGAEGVDDDAGRADRAGTDGQASGSNSPAARSESSAAVPRSDIDGRVQDSRKGSGVPIAGLSRQAALAELSRTLGPKFAQRLASRDWFNLVESIDQVPEDIRKTLTATDTIGGFVTPDGQVYVVTSQVGDNLTGIVLHEVGVHFGMSGDPEFAAIKARFKRLRAKDARVGKAYDDVPPDTDESLADEEALAYFVEQNWNTEHPLIVRIKDALRRFLNRLGVPMSMMASDKGQARMAADDLLQMAIGAARMAADGRITVGKDGALVYARDLLGEAPSETAQLVAQWKAKVDAKLRGDGRAYVKPSEGPGDLFGGPAEETSDLFAKPQQRAQGTLFSRKRDNSTAAEDRALDSGDLEGAVRIRNRRIAEQREALGDISNGVILKMDGRDSWAIVMPDVEGGGKWRMQMFDRRGFVGHRTRNSRDAALDEALQDKYTTRADGALDEIQDSPEFVRGNFIAGEMMQLNAGKITSAEFDRRIADYDSSIKVVAKYSRKADGGSDAVKFFDEDAEYRTVQDVLDGLSSGALLVHARVPDGTDFKYGIDPSAGDFLRSTEAWQTAEDQFGEGPELTFFAEDLAWAKSEILKTVRGGGDLELVFVRKSKDIQKSLGDGRVQLHDGKVVPYERSPIADYESDNFKDEPAGVESGDWYTNKSQDVVAAGPAKAFIGSAAPKYSRNTKTITINGTERPTTDSTGKAIHPTDEGIRAFYEWFGDSAVVDDEGRPRVVYHGTPAGGFDAFDAGMAGKRGTLESARLGIWFHKDSGYAGKMALGKDAESPSVYPVYLRLSDPLEYQGMLDLPSDAETSEIAKTIKAGGFDGAMDQYGSFVVLSPEQVKSATGNSGAFSPADKRIAYSRKAKEAPLGLGESAAIEPHWYNLAAVRGFFNSATDVLRRQPKLAPLADAIDFYFDQVRKRQGMVNAILRPAIKAASRADLDAFERYQEALQNARRKDLAEEIDNMTAGTRALVDAWAKVAKLTNDENQRVGVKVFDSKLGAWRPIGTARNFFPRVLKPEFQRAMKEPHKYPQEWNLMTRILKEAGRIQFDEEMSAFLNDRFSPESAMDYFAGIEKARQEPLPASLYDYSMEAGANYKDSWAERLSQIEAFGQKTGPEVKDKFDEVIIGATTDQRTKEYVSRIRERIESVNPKDPFYKFIASMNSLVTGLMLGNPATAALNIIGGLSVNSMVFPMGANIRAFQELRKLGAGIDDAVAKGILIDDYMGVASDAAAQGVSERLANLTQGLLNWGGYNATEYVNRVHAMLVGKHFLHDSIKAINKGARSRKAKLAAAFLQRNRFDVDKLLAESAQVDGERPETDRFLRFASNMTQGSYKIDQTPVFVDTPIGKFLFKYQKFGTQINRVFYQQVLKPFAQSVFKGGEPVTIKNPDGTEAQERVRTFLPLFRFLVGAIPGGIMVQFIREALFGYGEDGPDEDEIRRKLADGETAAAAAMLAERAFVAITAVGAGGFIGNYMQTAKDVKDRQRYKNPLDPPGLAPVKSFLSLALKLNDQGKLTLDDVEQEIQNTVSLYRTSKRLLASGTNLFTGEVEFAAREDARRDFNHVRYMARRYAEAVGIEAKRRAPSEISSTVNTPTNRAIKDALLVGDGETARALAAEYLLTFDNEADASNALQSIKSAIRMGQPAIVSTSPSEIERRRFLRWAYANLTPLGYQRIKDVDEKYRSAAEASGLWKPEKETAAMRREERADENKAKKTEAQMRAYIRSKGLLR